MHCVAVCTPSATPTQYKHTVPLHLLGVSVLAAAAPCMCLLLSPPSMRVGLPRAHICIWYMYMCVYVCASLCVYVCVLGARPRSSPTSTSAIWRVPMPYAVGEHHHHRLPRHLLVRACTLHCTILYLCSMHPRPWCTPTYARPVPVLVFVSTHKPDVTPLRIPCSSSHTEDSSHCFHTTT